MRGLRAWFVRLGAALRPGQRDRELADELDGHLQFAVEENIRLGMDPAEARRQALLSLGGLTTVEETCRQRRGLPALEGFVRDLQYGCRTLRSSPTFTIITVLTLALGIAAMTAMFSIVNGVLLRSIPYRDGDRLYVVHEVIPQISQQYPTVPVNRVHAFAWRDRVKSFEQMAVLWGQEVVLTGSGEPEQLGAARVTATFFELAGVRPSVGRIFTRDEEKVGHDVVIISDRLWQRRFGRDPSAIDKQITLDGRVYSIVGVLPANFWFPRNAELGAGNPQFALQTDLFLPTGPRAGLNDVGDFSYGAIAKLRLGVTPAQASAELSSVQADIASHLADNLRPRAVLFPLQDIVTGNDKRGLWLLFAAMATVLVIVCINVGSLILVRAIGRERDTAVRGALGASRFQMIRSVLAETVCVTMAAGLAGIPIGLAAVRMVVKSAAIDLSLLDTVSVDATVGVVALATIVLSALLCAALPLWATLRTRLHELLTTRSAISTRARTREVMVGIEIALTTCLLIVGVLLTQSFVHLLHIRKGFDVEHVGTLDVSISQVKYPRGPERRRFFDDALARLRNVPGVSSAAFISKLPLRGESWVDILSIENDPRPLLERSFADYRWVSAAYFQTVGIPIVAGRALEDRDTIEANPGVIVSQRVAEELWPGQSPLGQRIHFTDAMPIRFTVVGVAGNALTGGLTERPRRVIYVPLNTGIPQGFPATLSLVFRADGDPATATNAIRQRLRSVDPEIPLPPVVTMQEVVDESVSSRRFQSILAVAFAVTGLILALIGVYGALSYTTAQRTREFGVRLALGAERGQILRDVLREGGRLAVMGVTGGLLTSLAIARLIGNLLFGVSITDPLVYTGVAVGMVATMVAACFLPARRATQVQPLTALRYE